MKKQLIAFTIATTVIVSINLHSCKKVTAPDPVATLELKQDVFASDYNTIFTTKTGQDHSVPVVTEAAAIGRLLFYDPRLSVSGKTSCGSCHFQGSNFGDPNRFSTGFLNGKTHRNSMTIVNPAESVKNETHIASYFWDGRASNLFDLALMPAKNHNEMGMDNGATIVAAIKRIPMYQDAFSKHGMSITEDQISSCIAEFLRSMQTYNTKFDAELTKSGYSAEMIGVLDFGGYTYDENRGKKLFYNNYKCVNCHGFTSQMPMGPVQSSGYGQQVNENKPLAMNIGLDFAATSEEPASKFKPPTLRNIAYSAPYMHDGRFGSLEEVIDHYSHGIKRNPQLAAELSERTFNITAEEKKYLIAFLKTLSDDNFIRDKRFSNPFKN